jgi:hypothetical protein
MHNLPWSRAAPRRRQCRGCRSGSLRRLATSGEEQAPAIGTPGGAVFRGHGAGQAPRLAAAVRGHDPKIRNLGVLVVGRFDQRENHLLTVGAGDGCAAALHQPDIFVGDGSLRDA